MLRFISSERVDHAHLRDTDRCLLLHRLFRPFLSFGRLLCAFLGKVVDSMLVLWRIVKQYPTGMTVAASATGLLIVPAQIVKLKVSVDWLDIPFEGFW